MRRTSKERMEARRELALAVVDHSPRDPAEVREKAQRRITKAARVVLGHVLTDADQRWLDQYRPRRRREDAAWRQMDLPIAPERTSVWGEPQPACPACGSTQGIKRYEGGLCAPCADRADPGGRS